jgi:hypothetical protein
LTNQETFDKVVTALRAQGKPSVNPETNECMYRGPNGIKCAAGHLIPDDEYKPKFEGYRVDADTIISIIQDNGHDIALVKELQFAHDSSADLTSNNKEFMKELEKQFQEVAIKFDLEYKEKINVIQEH